MASTRSYTTEGILASLGYPDPLAAASQQARMVLLGRLARYQAAIRLLEAKWNRPLEEMHAHYTTEGSEDAATDDDYLEWRWYADAIEAVEEQLRVISHP